MRRFLQFYMIYWTTMLTILLTFAYMQGTRVSINLLPETFGIPAWAILIMFTISTVTNAIFNTHWKYHAVMLSPFMAYGVLSTVAYVMAGQSLVTGLISAHLYGGITVSFILFIAVKQDNQALRIEQRRLILDIEHYRHELQGMASEPK